MTISVVSHGGVSRGGPAGPTSVVTMSATPTAGNTLLALGWCTRDATSKNIDFPAGWTNLYHEDAPNGDANCFKIGYKVVSGETSTITWQYSDGTGGVSVNAAGVICVEVNGILDVASFVRAYASGHGNPHSIPSITPPSGVEALMVGLCYNKDPYGITTPPSLYAAIDDIAAGGDARLSSWSQHAASTSGSYTDTYNMGSGTTDYNLQGAFTALLGSPTARSFGVLI